MGVKNKNKFLLKFLTSFIFTIAILTAILFSADVFAITVDPGLGSTLELGTADLESTIINIIQWALGILGLVAVVMMIYGGFLWMTARGNEDQVAKAKRVLKQATIGLIIILLSWAIVAFIVSRINDATSPYPAHCTNGIIDPLEGETGIDCGGPCPACPTTGTLPTDTFTWSETQTSFAIPGSFASNVNRCSRVQPMFNHRIDEASFTTAFTNGHIKFETDDGTGTWSEFIPTVGTIEVVTSRNGITLKHDDDLFDANTDFRLWIPKYVLDLSSDTLETCNISVGVCNEDSNPYTGGINDSFVWYFGVGNEVDLIDPYITSTNPPDQYRNTSMSPVIEIKFNEAIDITSIDDGAGHPIAANFELYHFDPAGLNPAAPVLIPNTNFDVVLTSEGFNIIPSGGYIFDAFAWYRIIIRNVEDLCGNAMLADYQFEFQTTDLQPGISGRSPTGTAACPQPNPTIFVGFNTTMYYNDVEIELTDGVNTARANIFPEGMAVPPGYFGTGGLNSVIEVMNTSNVNEFTVYHLRPTFPLVVGTTYTVNVITDKVMDINGNLLTDTWTFTVVPPDQCSCEPVISHISPTEGAEQQCVTVNGFCFDGEGKATAVQPTLTFRDADNNPTNVPGTIGGWGANYITTTIPGAFTFGAGDLWPTPNIQITYDDPVFGTPSSNNNAIRYYINQNAVSTGPCLWSLNPNNGYIGTEINLSGDRFLPAAGTQHLTFQEGANNYIQSSFSNWINDYIHSWADTDGNNLVENLTYDVSVNNDGGQSNAIPYYVQVTPPGSSVVINQYPICGTACINIVVRASIINNTPNIGDVSFDLTGLDNTATVRLFPCSDANCSSIESPAVNLTGSTAVPNGTDIDLSISHPDFLPDKSYRVFITNGIGNADGGTIVTNYNIGGIDGFSWTFRTKNDPTACVLDHVDVVPASHTMPVGQSRGYEGYGRAPGDACDPNGQLVPVTNWSWTSSVGAIASITSINAAAPNNPSFQTATGLSAGGPITITGNADGIASTGQLTITDCETDQHCRNNCTIPGNQSVCINNTCTPWVDTTVNPPSGPRGTTITINGCYFGDNSTGLGEVTIGGNAGIFNCANSWTNNQIKVTTPQTIGLGGNPIYVYTDGLLGTYNNGTQAPTASFVGTNLCARMCDVASDNAFEYCTGAPGDCPNGTCLGAATPPAGGMPGLCDVIPESQRTGLTVEYDGFNLDASTEADFTKAPSGFVRTSGTYIDQNNFNNVTVPLTAETGDTKLVVQTGPGLYCASNTDSFGKYCTAGTDCASGCCLGNQCQISAAACSTGGPGSLCQLPANDVAPNPTCQIGPLVNPASDYSCIDFEGHSDPYPSPNDPGYPPAPGADCRVCCAPGQTNDAGLECNVNTVSACDGTDRGLYCGCQYDQANPGPGDLECDDGTGNIACGNDTCCHTRESLWFSYPADGDTGVCPNVSIAVAVHNKTLGPDSVGPGDIILRDFTTATDVDFTISYSADWERFYVHPTEVLDYSTTYEFIILGGPNGVLSNKGIALSTAGLDHDYDPLVPGLDSRYSQFITGDHICDIDHIKVDATVDNPPPAGNYVQYDVTTYGDIFTCASDFCREDMVGGTSGNQHAWSAIPYDAGDNSINPTFFNWTFVEKSDPLNIINIDPTANANTKYITSNNQNGRATVNITADGLIPSYGSSARDFQVTNRICENPWPNPHLAVPEGLPFEDTVLNPKGGGSQIPNFATWYCRDTGLPELERVADIGIVESAVAPDGVDEIIKHYLIELPRDVEDPGIGDGIGIQVWENEGGLSARDWYMQRNPAAPEPQALDVDGYPAVRDGRSVYIFGWNILGTGASGQPAVNDRLWPNIYIISHSETASQQMIEIFNQLVTNFELNKNIYDLNDKAAMKRDLKRISDLNSVYTGLLNYYDNNGAYPLLPGGTFIQKTTTSAWPSWNDTLGSAIGLSMPRDPLNTFVNCPFDATDTCWDDGDSDGDGQSQEYECPVGSHIYQYSAIDEDDIDLFGTLEYLHVNVGIQEEFYVGPDPTGERCGTITNATCPCFNYVKNTTGIVTDRLGPTIASVGDSVAPTATVTPGGTLNITGTETLTVSVNDPSGVDRVLFYVDNTLSYTDEDSTGPGWTWDINSSIYTESPPNHILTIRAYDSVGNWSEQNFLINVSNAGGPDNPPLIDILNHEDGDIISGVDEFIVVITDDGTMSNFRIDGIDENGFAASCLNSSVGIPTNPFEYTFDWDTINDYCGFETPNGIYIITAQVTDNSGQTSTEVIQVRVQNFDTTPPQIQIANIDGECSIGTCLIDGSSCNRYEVCSDGAACQGFPVCHQTNPCVSPGALCYREGLIPLRFNIQDLNTVTSASVFVGGNYIGEAELLNPLTFTWGLDWNTLYYPNGPITIQVIAYDEYGNEAIEYLDIIIDNAANDIEPPTLSFIHPPTPNYGVAVDGTVELAATADDNRGVVGVHFFVDYRLQFVDTSSPWGHSVDTTQLSQGWHTMQAFSMDSAGNISEADEILVNVGGNGGPSIVNPTAYPNNGATGDNICFGAEVTDSDGIDYVAALIQDTSENTLFTISMSDPDSDDVYTGSWLATLAGGAFYVDIIAADLAGNVSRANNISGTTGTCGAAPPGPVPVVNSPLIESTTVGVPFSYTISATNGPILQYYASPLESWMSFNSTTGVITGTPTSGSLVGEPYYVYIQAENSNGISSSTVFVEINVSSAPAITCIQACQATYGVAAVTSSGCDYTCNLIPQSFPNPWCTSGRAGPPYCSDPLEECCCFLKGAGTCF